MIEAQVSKWILYLKDLGWSYLSLSDLALDGLVPELAAVGRRVVSVVVMAVTAGEAARGRNLAPSSNFLSKRWNNRSSNLEKKMRLSPETVCRLKLKLLSQEMGSTAIFGALLLRRNLKIIWLIERVEDLKETWAWAIWAKDIPTLFRTWTKYGLKWNLSMTPKLFESASTYEWKMRNWIWGNLLHSTRQA